MTTNDAQFHKMLQNIERRLTSLERDVSHIVKYQSKWGATSTIHPISTNLSNIREMLLLEILRQKGILDGIDIEAIAEKVRHQLAGDDIPWGASKKSAIKNVKEALEEIKNNYGWEPAEGNDS